MPRSLIALGANLGDRQQTLGRAVELLAARAEISSVTASRLHETAPVGGPQGQAAFLNAAVALDTSLAPEALHDLLQRIERDLGRQRTTRWAPRAIDLDLLLFGDSVISTPALSVPHPRMAFRRFVLAPAAEVAPAMVHPLLGLSLAALLAHLDAAVPYVALLGMPDSRRPALAQAVAKAVGGSYLADPLAAASLAPTADPSGLAYGRQIQFLERAAKLLDSRDWSNPAGVAISDFYFDESLAHARVGLSQQEYEQIRNAWSAARDRVVTPKLLVVLDTWENGLAVRSDRPPPAADAKPAELLRRELLALANRGNLPVLYAGRDNRQAQFDEITAAIAAMG